MTKAVKELASLKDAVIAYVKEKYGASPENLWMRYPNYAIFRHADLNVKLSDPFLADLLVQ